ncbi:hypothetical protein GALL_410900 [mine drainage metagenome]|uniref:Uncharacterized protein n=1 Tax=mine drainage metagenome TaxID=410659 RepID=A0A1J5QB61_9ZZZZ
MILYSTLDLKEGNCVRLSKDTTSAATVFSSDHAAPAAVGKALSPAPTFPPNPAAASPTTNLFHPRPGPIIATEEHHAA